MVTPSLMVAKIRSIRDLHGINGQRVGAQDGRVGELTSLEGVPLRSASKYCVAASIVIACSAWYGAMRCSTPRG
jgi:hypothetical protein